MRIQLQHATSLASLGVIAVIIAFTLQVNSRPLTSAHKQTTDTLYIINNTP